MKDIFNTLSNVSQFFREKRFIYGTEAQHPSIEQVLGEKKGPKEGLETKESPDSLVEGEKAKGAEAVDNDSVGGPTKKEFDGMSIEDKWKTICEMTGLKGPVPPKMKARYEAKTAARTAARRAKMKKMVSKMGVLGVLNKGGLSKTVKDLIGDSPNPNTEASKIDAKTLLTSEDNGPDLKDIRAKGIAEEEGRRS